MYEIILSNKSKSHLEKLDEEARNRIGLVFERIKIRPEHFITRLVGSPYFKLRVGDYRIILDVLKGKLIIFVIEVGHRKNIYK